MPAANDLRRGMAIKYNGNPAIVLEVHHRTPGNLRAFVQAIIRYINTGKSADVRFGSTDKVELVDIERKQLEFSYKDRNGYYFMDPETYDTITLAENLIGEANDYLVENLSVQVLYAEGKHDDALKAGEAYYQEPGDYDFHYRIAHGAKNRRIVELLCGEMYHLIRIYRYRAGAVPGRLRRGHLSQAYLGLQRLELDLLDAGELPRPSGERLAVVVVDAVAGVEHGARGAELASVGPVAGAAGALKGQAGVQGGPGVGQGALKKLVVGFARHHLNAR